MTPKVGLVPVLKDTATHPLRPVQIQPGVWMVAYAPAWANPEQAAGVMRLLLGSDIEVIDAADAFSTAGDGAR